MSIKNKKRKFTFFLFLFILLLSGCVQGNYELNVSFEKVQILGTEESMLKKGCLVDIMYGDEEKRFSSEKSACDYIKGKERAWYEAGNEKRPVGDFIVNMDTGEIIAFAINQD